MTVVLSDLLAQKEAVERQIKAAQAESKAHAIARIRELMASHGLTALDLAAPTAKARSSTKKVAPKYRDPASGATWTGRGLKPKWLAAALEQGRSIADFAI